MVTNLDASIYPILKIPNTGVSSMPAETTTQQLLFDRILCDVPCSGDGTIRKNIGIWKSWQCMDGNGLHGCVFYTLQESSSIYIKFRLQVRILQRAMKLLRDDGRIVYSTCSLNPVENEAVVAEVLTSAIGAGNVFFRSTNIEILSRSKQNFSLLMFRICCQS